MSPGLASASNALRVLDGDLGQLVLDLLDDETGAEDADATGVGVDPDVDVLVAGDAAIRRLDAVLDGPDQLLTGDLLLRVELEEGAHEVSTHDRLLYCARCQITAGPKKNVGVTHVTERPFSCAEVYTRTAWTGQPRPERPSSRQAGTAGSG